MAADAAINIDTYGPSLTAPARKAQAVSPADGADLENPCKALWIGVAGDVKLTTTGGSTVTIKAPQGVLPVATRRVWENGTDATDIVALYD